MAVAWLAYFCAEKFIWNGVDIFVHFFTTPVLILNLTTSSESHENEVSNDILSERKYSQLFMHESNIFVKTVIGQINLLTPRAAMTPQSIYRLRTDRIKHHSISPAIHSVHLADIKIRLRLLPLLQSLLLLFHISQVRHGLPCIEHEEWIFSIKPDGLTFCWRLGHFLVPPTVTTLVPLDLQCTYKHILRDQTYFTGKCVISW